MFEADVVVSAEGIESEEELRRMFGEDALISRVGRFNLVHLDKPDPEEIKRRVEEFNPDDFFEDDCPLCEMLRKEGGNIVYDEGFVGNIN